MAEYKPSTEQNTLVLSTTSQIQSSYDDFIEDFVTGVNNKLNQVESSLYELGEYLLEKCADGKRLFGKRKDEVFNDLCSHPNFKYNKTTLYQYRQTAEFIKNLPEKIIGTNNLPFTTVQEIAIAKLPQETKMELTQKSIKGQYTGKQVRQLVQAKRLEVYNNNNGVPDWVVPYDCWQFGPCDPRFGEAGFPGRIPGQIILNLIHYYMEGDTFLSVYPGSHTDRDVCNHLGKTCIELDQDVTESWTVEDNSIDLVFHDPPYWHAKADEYQKGNDLSHLSLPDFYQAIDFTVKESQRVLRDGGVAAIIIGNERNPFEDLAVKVYSLFNQYFTPVDRIIVPYSGTSAMHTAWALARAKENKYMLNGYRDLMVFSK